MTALTRNLLVTALTAALAFGAMFAVGSAGAQDESDQRYVVVLDNAFGLTTGADVKSAGVKVGKVDKLDVQRSTARALATIAVTVPEFAGFKKDVFCEVKPQSLIGEYFLECAPGKSSEPAPRTIPVEQTGGTIPPDLVFDVLRRPARERLGLILAELGAGFAARGEDLQTTIRRGVPALRETDRVLRILHDNRRTLTQLTDDADQVLAALAANREDVARFVKEAADTTEASADRHDDLAATVNKLPRFLRELRPTLRDLGTAAAAQTPALRDLRRAAPDLTTLLQRLGPFAESARPAVRGLGRASDTGTVAVKEARSTVGELRKLGAAATEPMRNLRFVLEDINDRGRAVEPNRLSPTGAGFTGLEAFLQYVFVQSQAINTFDSKSHLLKLSLLINECGAYTNAEHAIRETERTAACKQWLGPNQPGVVGATVTRKAGRPRTSRPPKAGDRPAAGAPPAAPEAPAQPSAPAAPAKKRKLELPKIDPGKLLREILPEITDKLPKLPDIGIGGGRSARDDAAKDESERNLLDFLLGS